MNYSCLLTTVDNPFDPYDDFTSWWQFDVDHGYNSCGYLARTAKLNNEMTQNELDKEIERAIDEILKYDFMGIYMKITKEAAPAEDPEVEVKAD